jgi:uncharacterized protein YecT (DUF1311 family)
MPRIAITAAVLGGFLLTAGALTAPAKAFETIWNGVKVDFPDGQNYSACIEQANGSDIDMTACTTREASPWDRRLTQAFNELRRQLPAKEFATLQAFQRAWIVDRDATCLAIGGEGTAGRVMAETCYVRLTALRAVDLELRAGIRK